MVPVRLWCRLPRDLNNGMRQVTKTLDGTAPPKKTKDSASFVDRNGKETNEALHYQMTELNPEDEAEETAEMRKELKSLGLSDDEIAAIT